LSAEAIKSAMLGGVTALFSAASAVCHSSSFAAFRARKVMPSVP
jgi:hypothetical protein